MAPTNFHPIARSWYEYTDEDIHTLNKVRNYNRGYGYYYSPSSGAATSILMQEGSGFLQNSLGGIVLEAPPMAISGLENNKEAIIGYLRKQVVDMLELAQEARAQDSNLQIYPVKIIFPYNPSQGHWIAGEIIISQNANAYDIKLSQHNPMADYSQPISRSFCDLFEQVFRQEIARVGIQANVRINHKFSPVKIGRRIHPNYDKKVRIQQGGVACGVYTAYAIDQLKTGSAENMWDGFPYDGSGAMQQRNEDIEIVRQAFENQYGVEVGRPLVLQADYTRFVGGPAVIAAKKPVIQDFLQRAKFATSTAKKTPQANPRANPQAGPKLDPNLDPRKSKKDSDDSIQDLEVLIQQNLQNHDMLSALLHLVIQSPSDDDVKIIKATMLIQVGAAVDESMLDCTVQNPDLHCILVNEYYMQILKTASQDELFKFKEKYDLSALYLDYCLIKDGSNIFHNAAQNQQIDGSFYGGFLKRKDFDKIRHLPSSLDYNGHCPLTIAVLCQNIKAVRALIDIGADLNQDQLGQSIAEIAQDMANITNTADSRAIAKIINEEIAQQFARSQRGEIGDGGDDDNPSDSNSISDSNSTDSNFAIDSEYTVFEKITTGPQNFSSYDYEYASDLLAQAQQIIDNQKIKREKLTIDRSDFFTQKSGKYIVLTANEFSLQQNRDSDGIKRTRLGGSYCNMFKPFNKDSTQKDFQPYYANFGGLCFLEQPSGANIFNDAELFMANFRNCVFENVDFSKMNPRIFATIQFHKCVFSKCTFPQGIIIDSHNDIKPDTGIAIIADQIRAEANEALLIEDEDEKKLKIESLCRNLVEQIVPEIDAQHNITRKGEGDRISKERLDRKIPDANGIKRPIAHQCIVDRCNISLPVISH